RPGFKPQTGGIVPIGTPGLGFYLAEALFETGSARQALDYLREKWVPLAKTGTFAEHFGSDYNTSFCHGWGAGPVMQLPAYVLGIRPVEPGWAAVETVPMTSGLEWAEGTVPTPRGDIFVKWRLVDGKPKLDTKVPDGVRVVRAAFSER